jgi:hypothetical protein
LTTTEGEAEPTGMMKCKILSRYKF